MTRVLRHPAASRPGFLHINGIELSPRFDVDAAEAFMTDVAQRAEMAVEEIAATLPSFAAR